MSSFELKSKIRDILELEDRDQIAPLMQGLLAVCFGLLILTALLSGLMAMRAGQSGAWVAHTLEVRQVGRELWSQVQDTELAQRGYLLTEDPSYLDLFTSTRATIAPTLATLRQQTLDNPDQRARLDRLEPIVTERLKVLDNTIALAEQGRRNEAIAAVKTGVGKRHMDELRAIINDFLNTELSLHTQRQARTDSLRLWLSIFIGLSLASAAALGFLVLQTGRHYIGRLQERTKELEVEARRRRESEETLRQAQKIEAVGQLSGGIAHDFNNLLTIIMGNLDTIGRRLADPSPGRTAAALADLIARPLQLALQGARSAAELTQRLLAFSRRQALEPVRIDINKLVAGMSELLRRTLGETINFETVLAGGLWHTLVDANQLENAIINLAVNARDAMPEGGSLTIETANCYLDEAYAARFGDVTAGQYVLLSVSDTGTGIPAEVMHRIFEPFFTTKDTGKGSGLGLAMVHGFVKQSDGHIRVYSEPGQGTTVKVYLPRVMESDKVASSPVPMPSVATALSRAQGDETILVVEDNEGVRDYACNALMELGYKVLQAEDAAGAMKIIGEGSPIGLLFTDVVLPGGVSGRDLANALAKTHPHVPVLFTTGYTRNAIVHHGRLDPHVHLLNKPYTQQQLGKKVRQLLDGEPTTAGGPAKRT